MALASDSVRIVIFPSDNHDQFLIVTEADDPDNWKLTGGKFHSDDRENATSLPETAVEAAERELEEELGFSSSALTFTDRLINNDQVSARHIFGLVVDREIVKPTDEIADHRWVTDAEVPEGKNKEHILSAVRVARLAVYAGGVVIPRVN